MKLGINDKKPVLFQKTENNIWTDPHIRRQMLKAHLDRTSDGASRREESILRIIEFIKEHSRPGSALLDLGCGPGLYTSRLADQGFRVTGIDFNETAIAYAAAERNDIRYISGDYIKDYPEDRYDTVILIYCDMGTHADRDRDQLLRNIHRSLRPGGKLIFDVFTEKLTQDKKETESWEYAPAGGFWSDREYLLLSQTFHYPENRIFAYQYNLLSGQETRHFIVWEKYYSEEEITAVLKEAGFGSVILRKNILEGNNFTSGNEMFLVAEK